ncbi:AEC family transporter [Sphaerotilus microaerophilus]|jgi:hypothetical protein|uniref:Transporter n=1 Tax=Sphaerotilus microaerophilus TaxID=2914710 RepID=A0ABN6PIL0_9BURK|nr:AEC family transporter [Sphaerotilus sp. FB-5]BDI03844.1 transporter [Sphaerotilus sp. FB-5]
MLDVLTFAAPIFLLIGLGFAAVRSGQFPATGLPALATFVIRFALPALVFKALSQRDFAEVLNARYLLAYTAGSLVIVLLGLAWARWGRGEDLERGAFVAMGMACSNSAFIGFPLAHQVIGADAGIGLALCMVVENLLIIPLCLALADSGSATHEPFSAAFGRALKGLPKNPLIVAIAAGFVCSMLRLPLPAALAKAVDLLAGASAAGALFFIGGTLVGLSMRSMAGEVLPVALGKLLLHPLAVAGALWLVGPVGPIAPTLAACAVLMAAAPMLSIYPIFAQRHGLQGLCSARMVGTTLASFVSIGIVLWVLRHGGLLALGG